MCVDSFIDCCCCFKHYIFHPQICFFLQAGTILRTRPKRIILVRHGQSEGNIDESAYTRIPDSKIALTEVGWKQAVQCGKKIRHVIESDHEENWQVYFYVSPYRRTLQTLRGIGMAFERDRIAGVREEPRLREQDFGGYLP
jgi:broad specificity phosphatase PhoE